MSFIGGIGNIVKQKPPKFSRTKKIPMIQCVAKSSFRSALLSYQYPFWRACHHDTATAIKVI